MRLVGLALLLTACQGDDGGDDAPTPGMDTAAPPLFFEFVSTVPATELTAEISEAAVKAHQASNLLLASQFAIVADEKVQDELESFSGDGEADRVEEQQSICWTRPEFPRWTFTLAFGSACATQVDTEGAMGVERHPTQQLLFNYQNFSVREREMSGTLALNTLNRIEGVPYSFVLYDTELDNPGLDARTEVGVTLGPGVRAGIRFDGGAEVDFPEERWSLWGTSRISGSDEAVTVVHGGRSPEDVATNKRIDADVLTSTPDPTNGRVNWRTCRCATSGVTSQEMPLVISEVTIDIDDLEAEPDDVDDPTLTIPVDERVDGRVILNHVGCGEYDVEYVADPLPITLDKQLAFAELQFACDTRTIADAERCTAFQQALLRNEEDLVVDVTVDDLIFAAEAAVILQFDTNWCRAD